MTSPISLPILGGSLLAAVALGIHLGESAVSLINPIHFQGPAVHPRDRGAALDESDLAARRHAPAPVLYGWEQGYAARAADCGDCSALRARDAYAYSAVVPYFGSAERTSRRTAPVELAVADPVKDMAVEPRPLMEARKPDIARYAHYRVADPEDEREPPDRSDEAPYTADDVWLD